MSDKRFNSVLTAAGEATLSQAMVSGSPAGLTLMAVGDGGGTVPVFGSTSTGLKREVYRAYLNSLTLADGNKNIVQAEIIIPPQVGGFTIREAAIYDANGVCQAVASVPETYKPLLAEGAGRHQVIRIWLAVSNAASVQLTADPSVIVATATQLKKTQDTAKDYTDAVADTVSTQLTHAIKKAQDTAHDYTDTVSESLKAAISDAVKTASRAVWEDDNPVGTVRFFQQKIDPNAKWPWSTWVYLGENKTIRLGKQDGSDVFTTGGADSVTLTRGNLPNVQVDVSGTAAATDLGTKQTTLAGKHGHAGKFTESNTALDGGSSDRRSWSSKSSPNNEDLIQAADDHQHDVVLGPHGHDVSGKTAALGSGSSINITNSYIKLMGWYRTA